MTPIHNVRVIEIANFITGPYAGMLLADLGAEVIKVEHRQGGDPFRAWSEGGYSPQFRA
jgi:crotonobetainyl-CoA:carnitine CoA-transferase CaiB-like acyl-CoA transferase